VAALVTVGAIDMVAGDGSGEGRRQPRQVVEVAVGEGLGFRIVLYDTISEILFGWGGGDRLNALVAACQIVYIKVPKLQQYNVYT
jgi:hypothetical protein